LDEQVPDRFCEHDHCPLLQRAVGLPQGALLGTPVQDMMPPPGGGVVATGVSTRSANRESADSVTVRVVTLKPIAEALIERLPSRTGARWK